MPSPFSFGTGVRASSIARWSPVAIAVPPVARRRSSPALTGSRSVVGGAWMSASSANVTRPSRKFSGRSSVSLRAALTAADRRSGSTSSAFIEPEVSVTIITVAARCGAATVRCGRASATTRAASAPSTSSGGRCRRQPGRAVTRFGISAGLANDCASWRRRRCSDR